MESIENVTLESLIAMADAWIPLAPCSALSMVAFRAPLSPAEMCSVRWIWSAPTRRMPFQSPMMSGVWALKTVAVARAASKNVRFIAICDYTIAFCNCCQVQTRQNRDKGHHPARYDCGSREDPPLGNHLGRTGSRHHSARGGAFGDRPALP